MYELNKKKNNIIIDILLKVLLVLICFFNIVINIDTYKLVLSNNFKNINSINELDTYNKFAFVDLKSAKEENYLITNNINNVKIYTFNLEDNNILVLLKDNTIITDKTPIEIIKDNSYTIDIKEKLKNNNYYDIVLSNVNYNIDRKIELYKIYIIMAIIILSILSIIVSLFNLIKINKKRKNKNLYNI